MADIANSRLYHSPTGITLPRNACVVIVRTEWNAAIVDELEKGCRKVLEENQAQQIVVLNVPGAVEIPFAIHKYWDSHKYKDDRPQAFIALGCVIRGGTPHFEYVCRSVTDGVTQLNLSLPVPVIFGVLTVDTLQQAEERLGGPHGHKGEEAAITALKMIAVVESIASPKNNPGT
jgi:6,7-dimethyl-8-ribityllumazine synthase